MQNFNAVRAVWFSPTGSTKAITEYVAKSLAEMLGVPMKSSSYTLPADREMALNSVCSAGGTGNEIEHRPLLLPGELVVWGTPTYAGRIPNKTLDFVREVVANPDRADSEAFPRNEMAKSGEGNPQILLNDDFAGNVMIPIAVYGNRSFDNCLAELGGLMKKGGHFPIAGIAMPTRHTFSKTLGAGRPNTEDFKTLDEFCVKIRNKLMDIDIAPSVWEGRVEPYSMGSAEILKNFPTPEELLSPAKFPGEESPEKYYVPKRLDGEPAVFLKAKPQVDADKCTGCGTCTEVCPMGSVAPGPVFSGICIKCQACIQHCKNGALYFDAPDFLSHVAMLEANFASPLKKPELFL